MESVQSPSTDMGQDRTICAEFSRDLAQLQAIVARLVPSGKPKISRRLIKSCVEDVTFWLESVEEKEQSVCQAYYQLKNRMGVRKRGRRGGGKRAQRKRSDILASAR